MSGPAQVRSTEAIGALQAALAKFQLRVQNALDVLDGELRRVADWIEHDRPAHWRNATRAAEDAVHQAKIELERCLTFTVGDERPTCREQQAAVSQAKRHLDYCREKGEVVRRWRRTFRHESFEYDGRVGQLRRLLEHDVPKARGVLEKILRRLEEYQIERPPEAIDSLLAGGASDADCGAEGNATSLPVNPASGEVVPSDIENAATQSAHLSPPEPLDER